ncbi:hypothetical protein [Kineococcus sp. R86509]|uniref:hypothetical protein n=1 Tax=Kineococcus sp. R86509 TaxID=3093851 RepID=UPI0036D39D6A
MARRIPTFEEWSATAQPVLSAGLDHARRPAWLVDAAGERLDPAVLGWARIVEDGLPVVDAPQDDSGVLETAATIGVGVVLGIGFLGMAAFQVVSGGAGDLGWLARSGGSGRQEFRQPESWGRWTAPRSVTWTEAPALRFVEGGVLTGLPQIIDAARSRRGHELKLRVGRDHLELFTVRRSRGRFRWESTDVPVSRPVPDGCAPSWRVPHTEVVGAELLRSAKGEHWSEVERYVFALTFADGSSLHLDLETGRGDSARQLVRRRAGLPGPWSEPRPAEAAG